MQPRSLFVTSSDGLRLHALDWGARTAAGATVVCLPGLTRNARDFDALAHALAQAGRRVLAIDYRGRGLSQWDPKPARYDIRIENADILTVLAAAGVVRATLVGTSRGGLHAMLLGATRPALLAAVVLNDIGPVIDPRGIARIRDYVGKLPAPASWDEALGLYQRFAGDQFTALTLEDWRAFVRASYGERDGRPVASYDPALMTTLAGLDPKTPLPVLWPQFLGLRGVPVMAVRGANSDVLAAETLEEMAQRHPDCETLVVPGQGHAPLLIDPPTIARILAFVARTDAAPA